MTANTLTGLALDEEIFLQPQRPRQADPKGSALGVVLKNVLEASTRKIYPMTNPLIIRGFPLDPQTRVGFAGSPVQALRQQFGAADEPTAAHRWAAWNTELEGSMTLTELRCPLCNTRLSHPHARTAAIDAQACSCAARTSEGQAQC